MQNYSIQLNPNGTLRYNRTILDRDKIRIYNSDKSDYRETRYPSQKRARIAFAEKCCVPVSLINHLSPL